jgi:quercetin dioxygenase-like cupin family protein
MKISNFASGENTPTTRGGDRRFTDLLNGDDDAKDNFRLIHAEQKGEFSGPRHRHNFDQIRYCISGAMNYGPSCWVKEGEVAYYPEGAYYGPEVSDKEYVVLALQFGGPSGLGFTSSHRIAEGMEQLKAHGTFEKGIFRRSGELPPGTRRNQDSFEAVWEHLNGRRLEYPKPRYPGPILIKPDSFAWAPYGTDRDVWIRRLGVFTERSVEISVLKIGANGEFTVRHRPATQIGIILSGAGQIGAENYGALTTFSLQHDDTAKLRTEAETSMLLIGLPLFQEAWTAVA